MRLSGRDIAAFAAASGDRNPLHLDADFARRTAYGRPVAHGALVTIAALGLVPRERLGDLAWLGVAFHRPIFPGEEFRVAVSDDSDVSDGPVGALELRVTSGGSLATRIGLRFGDAAAAGGDGDGGVAAGVESGGELGGPSGGGFGCHWVAGAPPLAQARLELSAGSSCGGRYQPAHRELRALAGRLGAGSVPDALLAWLAWASWVVGMRLQGDHVFGRLTLTPRTCHASPVSPVSSASPASLVSPASPASLARGAAAGDGSTVLTVDAVDPRTGFVRLSGAYAAPGGPVDATFQTFVRAPIPPPTVASVAGFLPPGPALLGQHVLVVGGSRGLGAAVVGALASQGATAWAAYRHSDRDAAGLASEFGADRVRPVRCDAADPAELAGVADLLRREAGGLAGLVLAATPPLHGHAADPSAIGAQLDFVRASLAVALTPLAAAGPLLEPRAGGWLVAVSSSAVDQAPRDWLHYAAAKAALETYVTQFARQRGLPALIVRPPKMRTHLVDGPTGGLGGVPTEQVAASIVRWVLAGPRDCVLAL